MRRLGAFALTITLSVGAAMRAAHANPDAELRVRGSSRLEAVASTSPEGSELSGVLTDDAGRGVGDARIRVRLITEAGSQVLPRAQPCSKPARPAGAGAEIDDGAVAETDDSGRFCLSWAGALPEGKLSLSFDDRRKLLDSSSLEVALEHAPLIELAFSPPPRAFSAESERASVVVEGREHAQRAGKSLRVKLSWVRVDKTTTPLAEGALRLGEPLRLDFPVRQLGGAGVGELIASVQLAERAVETHALVPVVARVELAAPRQARVGGDGTVELGVDVSTALGAVPTGSVEALALGRTIGIAPVVAGHATLTLSPGPESGQLETSLRYLSASPWWVAGQDAHLILDVPRPSPWRWALWGLGLVAVASWVLAAWQRPRRRADSRAFEPAPTPARAGLEWVAARTFRGWSGHISDAHDGSPIAGVRVLVLTSDGKVAETQSGPDGEFALEGAELSAAGAGRIRFESMFHATLDKPLPPSGELSVALLTRRRALLAELVDWAKRRGPPFAADREPTPGEIGSAASLRAQRALAIWAKSVENAAFGPAPVDAEREAEVRAQRADTDLSDDVPAHTDKKTSNENAARS